MLIAFSDVICYTFLKTCLEQWQLHPIIERSVNLNFSPFSHKEGGDNVFVPVWKRPIFILCGDKKLAKGRFVFHPPPLKLDF